MVDDGADSCDAADMKLDDAAAHLEALGNPTRLKIYRALVRAGVDMPAGVTVKVVENTDKHVHLVLPPKPTGDISDESLEKIAAGQCGKEYYHHEPGGPG